ncbi:hypothetical protein BC832DRAFT_553448 [Gaertneriomyces semiglobifer]|nr:hypothetical protein BC832DRAFT_553448 [Gaertneriomyces semiglobifer]
MNKSSKDRTAKESNSDHNGIILRPISYATTNDDRLILTVFLLTVLLLHIVLYSNDTSLLSMLFGIARANITELNKKTYAIIIIVYLQMLKF